VARRQAVGVQKMLVWRIKSAMIRLRRLAGQMGPSPANRGRVMTACIHSVAMFGSGRGDQTRGTIGQANVLQLLVNQEGRATTGCVRTTNLGAVNGIGTNPRFGLRLPVSHKAARQERWRVRQRPLETG